MTLFDLRCGAVSITISISRRHPETKNHNFNTISQSSPNQPPHKPSKMVSSQQGYLETQVDKKADPQLVDERKAGLPLPDQPPVASDFNSADSRTVNVGSGGIESGISSGGGSLREPAIGHAGASGREAKDNLGGIPNDAVSRDQKDHEGLAQTTGPDYKR
ncbi:hypothetical protein J1614_008661 [Plenodomus biglobosus]|nr:hypothetical protein J1614_008661 [Plenodomus biglobosus]